MKPYGPVRGFLRSGYQYISELEDNGKQTTRTPGLVPNFSSRAFLFRASASSTTCVVTGSLLVPKRACLALTFSASCVCVSEMPFLNTSTRTCAAGAAETIFVGFGSFAALVGRAGSAVTGCFTSVPHFAARAFRLSNSSSTVRGFKSALKLAVSAGAASLTPEVVGLTATAAGPEVAAEVAAGAGAGFVAETALGASTFLLLERSTSQSTLNPRLALLVHTSHRNILLGWR